MKKQISKILIVFVSITAITFFACNKKANFEASYLPQDVFQKDTLSKTEFDSWFMNKKATENGLVLPANSLSKFNNNFDFYKWSEQMFLWITSNDKGKTVMESPTFYTVSPIVDGKRSLISHDSNTMLRASSSISQNGPNGLPMVIDKNGNKFEVESNTEKEKVLVKNQMNKSVIVNKIVSNSKGGEDFIDDKGNIINKPKAIINVKTNSKNVLHKFRAGNKNIFLDSNGNTVDVELGQAGSSGILMAENQSLVYYITMVNDVFAYYLSGYKSGKLSSKEFPTTQNQLDEILKYAKNEGWATPPDPNALAMEIKTSWVETKDLPNVGNYITIEAIVPTYDKSNPNKWFVNGERKAKLAMVGMHVVGSVAGHPEMVWATFEHEKNSPNAAYSYKDTNNKIKEVPADKGSGWLFNANASDNVDKENFKNMKDTIEVVSLNKKIDSVQVILVRDPKVFSPGARRIMAWGSASNTIPNQEDATPADANSQVIAMNNNVRSMLVGNDIRKNYLLIGATWTFGGNAPNGMSYPYANFASPTPKDSIPKMTPLGDAIGTAQLSNSTMETFVQSPSTASTYSNSVSCFSCHNNSNELKPESLSHVFVRLQGLKPKNNMLKVVNK